VKMISDKSHWLYGGLVGAFIGSIFSLYFIFQPSCVGLAENGSSPCPQGLDILKSNLENDGTIYLSLIIILFVIGSFVGWLFGKIKKRNVGLL